MEALAHVDAAFSGLIRHLNILQEATGHSLQGILGPGLIRKEICCTAAVYEVYFNLCYSFLLMSSIFTDGSLDRNLGDQSHMMLWVELKKTQIVYIFPHNFHIHHL